MMNKAAPKVIGAPESIWLCYGPLRSDLVHPKTVSPYDDEITWHQRDIDASDVKYVRADIAKELLVALKEVIDAFREQRIGATDTVWVGTGNPETLYDCCRSAVEKATGAIE